MLVAQQLRTRQGSTVTLLRKHWAIMLVLAIFAILGVLYSITTPLFETPGEPWHYRYVKHLADGRGLPPLVNSADEWEQGESHQPPLYYVLGALLTRPIDTGSADSLYERNPYATLGLPERADNKNAVLHLGGEDYPYRGVTLAVHLLRWFSVFCSLGTIWLTYRIGLEVAPHHRAVAIGAAALTAFNPQFVFISAGVTNDTLATLLVTWTLYLSVRVSQGRADLYRTPILLGVSVGLGALTNWVGVASAVLVLGAYGLYMRSRRSRDPWRDLARPLTIALGVAMLLSGWWYIRNLVLYGDILGVQAVLATRPTPPLGELLRRPLDAVLSFWGVFGWRNVLVDEVFYVLIRIMMVMGLSGLILHAARVYWARGTLWSHRWRPILLLALWTLLMTGSLLLRAGLLGRPEGRQLFPAISAISLFLLAGTMAWVSRRYAPALGAIVLGMFLTMSVAAPSRYIVPTYMPPQKLMLEDVPTNIHAVDVAFGDELFLLGYEMMHESATVGQDLHIKMYWVARRRMTSNYTFSIHVLGRQSERIGGLDTHPGGGNYPTSLWLPGDVIADDYYIPISADAQAPTAAIIRVGVYERKGMDYLPVADAHGQKLDRSPQIAQIRVAPAQVVVYEPEQPLNVNFDHKALLAGCNLYAQDSLDQETWEVALYWQSLAPMPDDYTVFLHLVNSAGEIVAQADQQPLNGDYPTHYWQKGEQVRDPHVLTLPANLPTGEYSLRVGLYVLQTGNRLPIVDAKPAVDYVELGPLRIEGNKPSG